MILHPLDPDVLSLSVGRRLLRRLLCIVKVRKSCEGVLLRLRLLLPNDIRQIHELLLQSNPVNLVASVLLLSILKQLLYLIIM